MNNNKKYDRKHVGLKPETFLLLLDCRNIICKLEGRAEVYLEETVKVALLKFKKDYKEIVYELIRFTTG